MPGCRDAEMPRCQRCRLPPLFGSAWLPASVTVGEQQAPGCVHVLRAWASGALPKHSVFFLPERENSILEPWAVPWQEKESLCVSVKVVNLQAETTAWNSFFFFKFTFMFVDSILN